MDDETAKRINALFARLPRGPWRKVKVMTTKAQQMIDRFLDEDPDPAKAYDLLLKVRGVLAADSNREAQRKIDAMILATNTNANELDKARDKRDALHVSDDEAAQIFDQAIEAIAMKSIDMIKRLRSALSKTQLGYTTEEQLAEIIRNTDRPFAEVIQTFAGFLTEHTMQIEVAPGERRAEVPGVKLQDTRGALVERNGPNDGN